MGVSDVVKKKAANGKAVSKKASSKNAASKNAVSKKAASKKTASKKTASKKTASKKTASKKTASKKTASKKTASKKTASNETASKNAAAGVPASGAARGKGPAFRAGPVLDTPTFVDELRCASDRLLLRLGTEIMVMNAESGAVVRRHDAGVEGYVLRCVTPLSGGVAYLLRERWDVYGVSEVRILDDRSGTSRTLAQFRKSPEDLQLSVDSGERFLVASAGAGAEIFGLNDGAAIRRVPRSGVAALTPDGALLLVAMAGKGEMVGFAGPEFKKKARTFCGPFDHVERIVADAAGRYVAAVVRDAAMRSSVCVWDRETGRPIAPGAHGMQEPHAIAIHPGGELLAVGANTSPGRLVVFRTSTGEALLDRRVKNRTNSVDFSADGDRLFVAAGEPKLRIFEVST
jgi:hypothetical protein